MDTKPVLCQQRDVFDSAYQLPDFSYQMKKVSDVSKWRLSSPSNIQSWAIPINLSSYFVLLSFCFILVTVVSKKLKIESNHFYQSDRKLYIFRHHPSQMKHRRWFCAVFLEANQAVHSCKKRGHFFVFWCLFKRVDWGAIRVFPCLDTRKKNDSSIG